MTIAAQVGAVARDDLQSLTLKRYGRGVAAVLLVSVVVVNLVTIAADLQAGAAGIGLLAGVGSRWLVVPLAAGSWLACCWWAEYAQVVGVLRYLMLGFLAFGAAAVLAHPDWPRLLQASLVPALSLRRDEVAGGLALLGTTLTSYVYVWETIGRGAEEPPDTTPDARGLRGPGPAPSPAPPSPPRSCGACSSPPRRPWAGITRRSPPPRTPPGRCARWPALRPRTCSPPGSSPQRWSPCPC